MKFAPNPILAKNMANFQNTVTGLLFTVFRWSICAYHVSSISRGLLNQIKMASLKNIITSLRIIVHCYSYHVYHQNDTLKHLLRNCHLKLLRPRRLQISKILSHASESSLSSSYLVLSIIVTFWSFYVEILAKPY